MPPASTTNIPAGELRLDPGPRARRKSSVNWKCLALSFVALVSLLGMYLAVKALKTVLAQDNGTRAKLYQDLTVPFTPREIVRPLVDNAQTFDVVVTVWLRQDIPKTHADEGGPILSEKAIFSDTIFRGLHLEDKSVKTAVELKIPTDIFKSPEIWTYDLRASFVLVPNSPSPLDYAVNYSSWIPEGVNYPPMRSWPAGYSPSLADRVVDSYGAFLPLLVLNRAKSNCPSTRYNKTKSDEINDKSDAIFDLDVPAKAKEGNHKHPGWLYRSTRRASALEAHPYIITKSHLRVADMTRIFNRTEYEKQHRDLRDSSCDQRFNGILDWRFCTRQYERNLHGETRIKLRKQDPDTGKNMTEWAYSPYMSLSETAWGPLDLVKVPVSREVCQNATSEKSSNSKIPNVNEDFVNITWKVSFSGITPSNLLMDDRMGILAFALMDDDPKSDTDAEKEKTQNRLEFISGLTGHRTKEDAHPRRQLVLVGLFTATSLLEGLLELCYWFSRASTVGISIPGSLFIGGPSLVDILVKVALEIRQSSSSSKSGFIFGALMGCLPFALTPLFMLKAALRAELKWYKRWIPVLRRAPPTHSERASQRLEKRISWMYKAMAFAALSFVFTYYPDLRFLSSENAGPVGGTERASDVRTQLGTLLISPSIALGRALQLAFNHRAKSFAGMYRICAPMLFTAMLFGVAKEVPHVVGHLYSAQGVSLPMIFNLIYAGVFTWQAVRYAPAAHQEEDESSK